MPVDTITAFKPISGKESVIYIDANLAAHVAWPQKSFAFHIDGKKAISPYGAGLVSAGNLRLVPGVETQEEMTVEIECSTTSLADTRLSLLLPGTEKWCIFTHGNVPFMHVVALVLFHDTKPQDGTNSEASYSLTGHIQFASYIYGLFAPGWGSDGTGLVPPANWNGDALTWPVNALIVAATTGVIAQKV